MATAKKKVSRKKVSKKATTKKATTEKAAGKKAPAKTPNGRDSMAAFMNALAASGKSADQMEKALQAEAKRRGLNTNSYTFSRLRAHVAYRQSKGQLQGVKLPEVK